MPDILDEADAIIEKHNEIALKNIRHAASQMPKGTKGDCDLCGEWSVRLVDGACAPCRDKYKLG